MKKLVLTLLITLGVAGLVGCSMPTSLTKEALDNNNTTIDNTDNTTQTENTTTTEDPISYNDNIVAIQTKALDAYNEYDQLVENTPLSGDFKPVEEKRIETLKTIKDLQKELSKMDGYEGDTALRDAFVENLTSLTTSLENEEKELVKLYIKRSKTEGDLPQDEVDKEKELLNAIGDRDDKAYKEIIKQQEAFADKYDYQLEGE